MHIIGLMSGTSLDGLDLAYCDIDAHGFHLLAADTYTYDTEWTHHLSHLEKASARDYAQTHVAYGHYLGQQVNRFRQEHPGPVKAIASHGHTVFHQPDAGFTAQIGDGNAIAAETGLPVVYNFRALDVALGGQGAPLVPIGDQLLFGSYDACLNLGGIANISYPAVKEGVSLRLAYDICPCNMALNTLSNRLGHPYDRDGQLALSGQVLPHLLQRMEALEYYCQPLPKTLGREWFDAQFLPLLSSNDHPQDLLRTTVEHIALQIARPLRECGLSSLLATGGGAKNRFLIERLQALTPQCHITVPEPDIIDYKEAIIFALLGYLRLTRQPNCLRSVTGARCDNCGGDIAGLSLQFK